MSQSAQNYDRRRFLKGTAATLGALSFLSAEKIASIAVAQTPSKKIKLGMDNFAVRAMKWKAPQLLDHAASLKLDVILLSDLDVYESFEESYLKKIKEQADRLGIQVHAGTGSICPSAHWFNKKHGTAEEHLALAIRVAKALGSPAVRCVLGSGEDRKDPGGIEKKIEETIKVCKSARSLALDSGVKIGVENHAGDMQAWELAGLVEAAGKDYVGVCLDSGNAVWTLEDPLASLEILGPYAATSSLRDSAVWESERGAMVEWTDMGDGQVDWKRYVARFAELCPDCPFNLETISYGAPRPFNYLDADFWSVFPKARAEDFAKFVAYAKRGKPPQLPPGRPAGDNSEAAEQARQKYDLERSVKYCREVLGLGTK